MVTTKSSTSTTSTFLSPIVEKGSNFVVTGNFTTTVTEEYKCNKNEDCYFWCSGHQGCEHTILDATNANNLYIECRGHLSCYSMDIYVADNVDVTVICNNTYGNDDYWGSCEYMNFYAPYANKVNIICANHWDCYAVDYYIDNVNIVNAKIYGYLAAYFTDFYMTNVTQNVTSNIQKLVCFSLFMT